MKISVSLAEDELEFIDEQTRVGRYPTRSAALRAAIGLLRDREYTDSYAAAWDEWDESGDGAAWSVASPDGIR